MYYAYTALAVVQAFGQEGGKPVSTSEMGDRIIAALDASL